MYLDMYSSICSALASSATNVHSYDQALSPLTPTWSVISQSSRLGTIDGRSRWLFDRPDSLII